MTPWPGSEGWWRHDAAHDRQGQPRAPSETARTRSSSSSSRCSCPGARHGVRRGEHPRPLSSRPLPPAAGDLVTGSSGRFEVSGRGPRRRGDAVEEGRACLGAAARRLRRVAGRPVQVDYLSAPTGPRSCVRASSSAGARLRASRTVADGRPSVNASRRRQAAATAVGAGPTSTAGDGGVPPGPRPLRPRRSRQPLLFIFITSRPRGGADRDPRLGSRPPDLRRRPACLDRGGEAVGRIGASVAGLGSWTGATLLFGASRGGALGALLLMLFFATVAGGAGMLLGALAKTSSRRSPVAYSSASASRRSAAR